ncbi:M56 family metallopeptidase [uncultured Flavobacterium sp.]|uniref:M56 family metallopeptidase n=1 Tax=uncultured Flavobacterium sp. TaxID=165435 RepID=UPI000B24E8F2|nr:M56 family metallopeptidase [uncultured Flavobacterium sp.]
MENLIIYLTKASGLIVLFYVAYYTLLKKETFFNSNRWFLLAGLVTSAALPLFVITKTVIVEAVTNAPTQEISVEQLMALQQAITANEVNNINWYTIIAILYFIGALFFFIRFVIDLRGIRNIIKGKYITQKNGFKYIDSESIQSPFSFFNYIAYNSKTLNNTELENIISHEKVHSAQKHSIDMIISQLFCIIFWFNPFIWFYKKGIAQNLEFIADAEATKQIEDIKAYQKTLLKITVQPECTAIINHFYQSLIKKRIVMLNKKQSKTRNSWKYAVVLPVLVAFMLLFQLEVKAQIPPPPPPVPQPVIEGKINNNQIISTKVVVSKDTKEEQFETYKSIFKKSYDADVAFKKIARNNKGEITSIYISVKDKDTKDSYPVREIFPNDENKPIPSIAIEMSNDGNTNQVSFKDVKLVESKGKHVRVHKYVGVDQIPPPPPTIEGEWSINKFTVDNKDALIVIDGIKQKKGEIIKIPINQELDEVHVLNKKKAKKKYGRAGKKGAIEIKTKKKPTRHTMRIIKNQMHGDILIKESIEDLDGFENETILVETISDMDFDTIVLKSNDIAGVELLESLSVEDFEKIQENLNEVEYEVLEFQNNETLRNYPLNKEEISKTKKDIEEAKQKLVIRKKKIMELRKQKRLERTEALEKRRKILEERKKARQESRE